MVCNLTLCLFFCGLPSFFENKLFRQNSFRNTFRVSNSLNPDQDRHYVCPDLGPNCLQRLPADDSKELRL